MKLQIESRRSCGARIRRSVYISSPNCLTRLGYRRLKPRHAAALALVGQSCLFFGVASLLLSMVGLFLAFAYGNDSVWALIVIYIAFWPNLVLGLFLSHLWSLRLLFFFPIAYIFGIPLIGWALLGIPAGLWRARHLDPLTVSRL